MKKHAVALRAFDHADDSFAKGDVILDLDAGYLAEWSPVGLVREATAAEVAKARGGKTVAPTAKKKRAPSQNKAKAKAQAAPQIDAAPDAAAEPSAVEAISVADAAGPSATE